MPALLLSILTPPFIHSSSVSLPYFIVAVLMRKCPGRVDDLSFFDCLSLFCLLLIELNYIFFLLLRIIPGYVYCIVFSVGSDRPPGLLFFSCSLCFFPYSRTPTLVLPSSVSLAYFTLVVPMPKCLGKHSCMCSFL